MLQYQIEKGASTDQGFRAHMQVPACTAIIPPREAERLLMTAPPMTEEQALWMRRVFRSVDRAIARRQQERHERLVDAIASAIMAISLAFLFYCWLFLGLL